MHREASGRGRRPHRRRDHILRLPLVRSVLSAWAWLALAVLLLVWLPMMALVRLVTSPFDRGRYATGYLFRKLAVVHQTLNPLWRFRRTGVEIDDPRRPYVVVANHESFVDILLISHLPWEMKWLAKSEFFDYPVVGWLMRLADDIRLVRGERDSVLAAMSSCRDRLSKRVSVMIFPEGTRTSTGDLSEFKDGAFRLAIEAGVPVLPLAVHGAYTALNKGDWRFGITDAEVRVLAPIPTDGMTLADVPALRDRARGAIADALATMR